LGIRAAHPDGVFDPSGDIELNIAGVHVGLRLADFRRNEAFPFGIGLGESPRPQRVLSVKVTRCRCGRVECFRFAMRF